MVILKIILIYTFICLFGFIINADFFYSSENDDEDTDDGYSI